MQINARPEHYQLEYLNWDSDKAEFIQKMESLFCDSVIPLEKNSSPYDFIISAMKRWYIALPKYAKEMKVTPNGENIDKCYVEFMKLIRQNQSGHEFLFEAIPQAFGYSKFVVNVYENITVAKKYYDEILDNLRKQLCYEIKELFISATKKNHINQMSLTSVIKDWCETLDPKVFEQIFNDGTNKFLSLMRNISNDENTFIESLARLSTDLRLEDWNDHTLEKCIENLKRYKNTAEKFHTEINLDNESRENIDTNVYQNSFGF